MTTYTAIDLNWTGRPKAIAALVVESGDACVVVDPGPESTLHALHEGLKARGRNFRGIDALLITHIHLDHAGATGALVRENPDLQVYVHELGAPHMVDPSRLLASAGRLYGGDMTPLYGECRPVPEANLQWLAGGELIEIGETELEVFYTPGHASHHVSYWDKFTRTAMVGDTAGITVEGDSFLLPPTPPPDIDIEVWTQSLDAVDSWKPERLFLTHFGFIENPAEHIRRYKKRIADWAVFAQKLLDSGNEESESEKTFVDSMAAEIRAAMTAEKAELYIFNGGLRLSWLGLVRYWKVKNRKAQTSA